MDVEIFYRASIYDKDRKVPVPIFGIEHYSLRNENNNPYVSKKSFQFYKDGEHQEYFFNKIKIFYENRCKGDIQFDLISLVPTHTGALNENMKRLTYELSKATNLKADFNLIRRTKETKPLHEIMRREERIKVNEESLEVIGEVYQKNIIVMDNVSTSGSTAQVLFHKLKDKGAEIVIFIVLGLGIKYGISSDFDINANLKYKVSEIINRFKGKKLSKEERKMYSESEQSVENFSL